VQTLIAERYKVKLGHSSVCRLLHQLGLSAQRPLWRAYQQNPDAVKQWLETDYPAIRRRARHAGAQIFFADEAGVRSDFHSGTTWGRPPPPDRSAACPERRPGAGFRWGRLRRSAADGSDQPDRRRVTHHAPAPGACPEPAPSEGRGQAFAGAGSGGRWVRSVLQRPGGRGGGQPAGGGHRPPPPDHVRSLPRAKACPGRDPGAGGRLSLGQAWCRRPMTSSSLSR
jgi:Winged helix-turn helix